MLRQIKKLNYEEIKESCKRLAEAINKKGWQIDVIVPILKGGVNIGALIGNELDIDEFCFIHTRSTDSNKTNAKLNEPRLLGVTNAEIVRGKNVLLCDDIFDTGRSIKLAEKTIKELGAEQVYMAVCVNVNKNAEKLGNLVFDLNYTKENHWIVFPWEKV